MAPAVPIALSRPTMRPVSVRSPRRSLTMTGDTAESTAAGAKNDSVVSVTMVAGSAPRSPAPRPSTIGTDSRDSAPPIAISGPSSRPGS